MQASFPFYEFFAGGGLARVGLGEHWDCLFANDISEKKGAAYQRNFSPAHELIIDDIHNLTTHDLPASAMLSWASFPCQDLSLAGNGGGLKAERSGTFWPFWMLMVALNEEGRGSPIIVLENVIGLLSSNKGNDFRELVTVLVTGGYRVGALVVDALYFVPQSRPRLFFVAVKRSVELPENLTLQEPGSLWHNNALINAYCDLPVFLKDSWVWWNLPPVDMIRRNINDIIEQDLGDMLWNSEIETQRLLSMMTPQHLAKVKQAQFMQTLQVGTIYKRTRVYENGKGQRAEVRFDGISGCLRTPTGGSSRQTLLFVEGERIRSRLLSVREAARLMGLPETYQLPDRYNDGYHIMGDAVVVPVVAWLEAHLLRPIAARIGVLALERA